jgi:hypothetical protein
MDPTYDILFAGDTIPGAARDAVRRRIQTWLRLTDGRIERLFAGDPVCLKRGVDAATAVRYREAFSKAGALVQLVPSGSRVAQGPARTLVPAAPTADVEAPRAALPGRRSARPLQLAPMDNQPLETVPAAIPPATDISHLSLTEDGSWTLADCAPSSCARPLPDVSHLSLATSEVD